jgi:hypothetical protein
MTKTIKIKSKREFLSRTPEEIIFGAYKFSPASNAATVFAKAANMYNDSHASDFAVKVIIKHTDEMQAKIKISGAKDSVLDFINRVITETDLLKHFDIKI